MATKWWSTRRLGGDFEIVDKSGWAASCFRNEKLWNWRVQSDTVPGMAHFSTAGRGSIPFICHRHHRRCLCKKKLPGVNFYRFNTKNWQFTVYFVVIYAFFQCKFYSPKILSV